MIDLSKKYYAVHVQTSNSLNGIHYIPFTDEDIEQMERDFHAENSRYYHYEGEYLREYMKRYLKEKFSFDCCEDANCVVYIDGSFSPVNMEAIIKSPIEPLQAEVFISIGEDECIQFTIPEVEEEIKNEKGEHTYEGSIIYPKADSYDPCIQIHRRSCDLPHLSNTIHISKLSVHGIDLWGRIESVETDDNTTTYHCSTSIFPFKVQVIYHTLYWYDDETPIYKE